MPSTFSDINPLQHVELLHYLCDSLSEADGFDASNYYRTRPFLGIFPERYSTRYLLEYKKNLKIV
jgi:hypothetical protein